MRFSLRKEKNDCYYGEEEESDQSRENFRSGIHGRAEDPDEDIKYREEEDDEGPNAEQAQHESWRPLDDIWITPR